MSYDLFWTYPSHMEIDEEGKTVYDLLDEYQHYIHANNPERLNPFYGLCRTQPEATRAEAVAFAFFKWNGYAIRLEETPDEGGVDFRAQTENTELVIEVTSIRRATFTEHSGVPENPWESCKGFHVDNYEVARQIWYKTLAKAEQMSGYDCPTILIIACEHVEYQTYLKKNEDVGFGAEMLLTSPPELAIPKSISAVLLFHISEYHVKITGLLPPKPDYHFSIELLPSVPFVEVLLPEIGGYSVGGSDRIRTRWIPDNLPDGYFIYNQW